MIRNPYSAFLNLLPQQIRWIGVIKQVKDEGSAYVRRVYAPDNTVNLLLVNGSSTGYEVNDTVMIQDNNIVSKLAGAQNVLSLPVI